MFELQEIRKSIFVNPTSPIWAFSSLILAYWTRVRMQISILRDGIFNEVRTSSPCDIVINLDVIRIFNEVSPLIDIKKRKCSQNCIQEDFDIIIIIKQLLSVSVLLCYMIESLNWDLRMRVIHDIIACYSEIHFSMLFSRYESDTLISQFATYSNLSGSLSKSGPLDFGTINNFPSFFVSEKGLAHIYKKAIYYFPVSYFCFTTSQNWILAELQLPSVIRKVKFTDFVKRATSPKMQLAEFRFATNSKVHSLLWLTKYGNFSENS